MTEEAAATLEEIPATPEEAPKVAKTLSWRSKPVQILGGATLLVAAAIGGSQADSCASVDIAVSVVEGSAEEEAPAEEEGSAEEAPATEAEQDAGPETESSDAEALTPESK